MSYKHSILFIKEDMHGFGDRGGLRIYDSYLNISTFNVNLAFKKTYFSCKSIQRL